ncbi:MAG TPA: type II secretion system protein [Candidatus Woesebacteria bacterium]|nr:type II secretion system protein [Candidatus Woesebacteria bacterium]
MQKAFTLIELIIVIMIMSVFAGIGFTTYTKQIQTEHFDQDIETFVSMLEQARTKTIAKDTSAPNDNCKTKLSGYQVTIYRSSDTSVTEHDAFRIKARCGGIYPAVTEQYKMENTVIYNGGNNTLYNVDYSYPYGCISSDCTKTTTISFKNKVLNVCKNVVINALGNPSVDDITCPP